MRLQEFLQERDRLNSAINQLAELEATVSNARWNTFRVGDINLFTGEWQIGDGLRETIVASINAKRKALESQLVAHEARCTIS